VKARKKEIEEIKGEVGGKTFVLRVYASSVRLWRRLLSLLSSRVESDGFVRAFVMLILERLAKNVGGVLEWEVM